MNDNSNFLFDLNESWSNQPLLQEPVPFEEFEFSFGNSTFNIPLDNIPQQVDPIYLQKEPPNYVLDENDQRAFSSFLDSIFYDEDYIKEESRRCSILKSLDEQKEIQINKKQSQYTTTTTKKKELLTEEEKRANHIASEQKRRSMIRNGFKELTELVPTLKNINNSKSTVLFKAVEYIRYLEKKNKTLKEKVGSLEIRMKVEGPTTRTLSLPPQKSEVVKKEDENSYDELPENTRNALLAHKTQQKQLLLLQEQLQLHQRLIQQKHYSILNEENKAIQIL
ncbi:hypothetical protein G6F57_008808 [Rhizopus arrhizus]|uniref:BHLH domain-containing protein n=1 Tax=Rhizopus oryzae TaxID=64495 RepID=A0A9P6X5U0_RHIOR|nr:hypothetical protein G6F24_002390 [Rhizopus arrhizus]KAG1419326.1 hypothetical protein G6F58_004665 [Rhizopus delemar]KAG0792418.1 hypothetical protein G6F21_004379 [Rhizopus arrhizus]KAG0799478.1 hypothetical protein G6F22_003185 [Rhizopus arrhizus]KAG0815223.1 hypothetical protein G6F20_004155 [Rhizopus arrhizus]